MQDETAMPFDKHPALLVREQQPFNAGPPPALQRQDFVTPSELFFVRNHGTVPAIDPTSYRLTIGGMVGRPLSLSLDELRDRFPSVALTVTLQCAGNRRSELMAVEPIPQEAAWATEAISNAQWRGVPLREVLLAAEFATDATHVAFDSLDEVERHGRRFGFGGSIPLDKALGAEVLLAYEMNGAPLPPTHGFPLRVVTPGYIGARSVKWLAGITLQTEPSDNYFQAHAYKLFPPHIRAATVDWASGLMLGELSISAVISSPLAGATLPAGEVLIQGYALAGGGRRIERVDVSSDGGETWMIAELVAQQPPWAWCFWEARLALAPGAHQLVARAWDSAANTQPEDIRKIWNFKGYMNNAWHRIDVDVAPVQENR